MIKSLGPGLDSLDFLRIALGSQHLFIVIQNSNLSKPLVLTWPQLLQQIQDQINVVTGGVTSVNGQTGVVVLALDDLSDVNAASPTSGQFLQWNGSEWVPSTVAPGGVTSVNGDIGPAVILNLGDLNNVIAPSPSVNQILQWNGSAWVPATVSTGVYTADNGLTMLSNNVALGSASSPGAPLLGNRYIDTGSTFGLYLEGQKTNQNDAVLFINNTASGGTGLNVTGTGTSAAIKGSSVDSFGVFGGSNTSFGVIGQTLATGRGGVLSEVVSAATNLIALGLRVRHLSSATPIAGFGVSIDFRGATSANAELTFGRLMYQWTDAVTASRTSKFQIETVNSATASVKLEVLGSGQLILNQYTTSTSFGSGLTSVGVLNVDNTGKVFVGPGGGVPTSRQVATADSLTGGGDLSADRTLSLVNDQASPGANKVYGTDSSGTKGWKADPSGGGGILHATASGTNTYTATIAGVTAYNDGDAYLIRFTNGNDVASPTLNINSIGAINLYRNNDGQLLGGDISNGGEMLCVYNSSLNVFQCIGTSPNSLFAYVTNVDTVAITKGMPVVAWGGTGDRMTVQRAYNTDDAYSAQTIGLVYSSSIGINQKGFIMIQGLLDGLNIVPTPTWADGDPVYLGSTAGTITKTKPYAPNHLVYLGFVTTANPGNAGRIYVKVQNGYELDEIHDVALKAPYQVPINNDVLTYITGSPKNMWQARSVSSLLPTSVKTGSFGVTVDGVTGVVQVGQVGYVVMPYDGTITRWTITSNVSGSISFDIWKDASIDTIPTIGDSIVGGVYPSITGTNFGTSTNLTSWTSTTFSAGHIFGFYVNSASTIKNATLTLRVTKS